MITRFFLSWLLVRHILLQTSRTKINSKPRFTFVYCTIWISTHVRDNLSQKEILSTVIFTMKFLFIDQISILVGDRLLLGTVEPRLTATSVIRSSRYYGDFFRPPSKNDHTFSCKETLVKTVTPLLWPIFFGPLVTVLRGFHCHQVGVKPHSTLLAIFPLLSEILD